ncbi:hypothetical protein D1007_53763 [Hordeum vulgare]|nr:hypothetical protein D1007_53763 [Hordeum vulgare]
MSQSGTATTSRNSAETTAGGNKVISSDGLPVLALAFAFGKMTTGDASSSVVVAVDAPPPFFAGGGGRIAVDDSATGTGTGTATGDTSGQPSVLAGSRRRHHLDLVLVRPKFEADGKKPSSTSVVAEGAASSSGNGASGLPATTRKIRIASRRHPTDTSEKGASSPRLALPWTATAVTSEAIPPARKGAKRRKLVPPSFGEGAVGTLRISSKADACMAVEALERGQKVKVAISEDLALREASEVAEVLLPFHPRLLDGADLLILCRKISEQVAVNSRLQTNQSALAVLETQSSDLHHSIARDRAMLR